ncbi:hypothetical protein T4D_2664 [Trichinella pseudospiralis]|uniref:Uncharacterized protein n=1 Tax=Trichinella pseudospiralis TaxID=6337 RepID=A0A0V1FRX5_TRIPS|nr:hypothetical protein T4D_2664 [Trichinella pseudospiralis]
MRGHGMFVCKSKSSCTKPRCTVHDHLLLHLEHGNQNNAPAMNDRPPATTMRLYYTSREKRCGIWLRFTYRSCSNLARRKTAAERNCQQSRIVRFFCEPSAFYGARNTVYCLNRHSLEASQILDKLLHRKDAHLRWLRSAMDEFDSRMSSTPRFIPARASQRSNSSATSDHCSLQALPQQSKDFH